MAKRAAAAPPPASDETVKRLKSAVRTLFDELVAAEHELKVRGEKLKVARSLLSDAAFLVAPHPCVGGEACERDALIRLHDKHHACSVHFSDLLQELEADSQCV